jgi:hypothetical protein
MCKKLTYLGMTPTTMLYVQLAPQDVWHEYARAAAKRTRLSFPEVS